ncbi:MAG: phosphoribosylanthranilate isomerase [Actinomycetota bacterium]|nr:phosphoribosylanthranilate isomerase [Actinomycetota bacterium]
MRTRVKICGITNPGDAALAVEAGADALGVVLAPSTRQLSIAEAARALADVPPLIARVGVFVNADPAFVAEAIEQIGLTAVQFHGDETPEHCAACAVPVIKAFGVGTEFALASVEPFRGSVAALLLDKHDAAKRGGTGQAFDWQLLTRKRPGGVPFLLAGGLDPLNVFEAIRTVRPFAVDVSSGVEERPGHKDPHKLTAFMAAVRAADQEG